LVEPFHLEEPFQKWIDASLLRIVQFFPVVHLDFGGIVTN
jgi:hypothetical protein